MARGLATLFEIVTVFGAMIGAILLIGGIMPGTTAIQTAATSATAVAFVAIPYAVAGIFHRSASRRLMSDQVAALAIRDEA
jgi:hypothetical protein